MVILHHGQTPNGRIPHRSNVNKHHRHLWIDQQEGAWSEADSLHLIDPPKGR